MSRTPPPAASTWRSGVYIGRFLGIRFYLDYSWFLIAAILVYSLSTGYFGPALPGVPRALIWLLGGTAALLFFLSILLHELGHSVVSQRCGIRVPRITLLFIGGIAEISREPDDPNSELKIAVAGPAVTLVLVLLFGVAAWLCHALGIAAGVLVFKWLALVNLSLLVFNALPGYPLDGGRVLRALIWARTGNFRRATHITSRIGVALSWVLIVLGFLSLFHGAWNAFVFFLIGIFLKNAAESGYTQALYKEALAGVHVRDIMTKDPVWVPASMPASRAVDEFFLVNHHIAYPVCDGDTRDFRGLLRMEFLKEVPREKWPYTSAGDIVAAAGSAGLSLSANETAARALRRLLVPGQGRLAVLEDGKLAGMLTRADVLQFIRIHTELEP